MNALIVIPLLLLFGVGVFTVITVRSLFVDMKSRLEDAELMNVLLVAQIADRDMSFTWPSQK